MITTIGNLDNLVFLEELYLYGNYITKIYRQIYERRYKKIKIHHCSLLLCIIQTCCNLIIDR